jgi:hypothetical protein
MPPNEAAGTAMEPWVKFRFKLRRDVLDSRRAGNDGRCAHERVVRKNGSGFPRDNDALTEDRHRMDPEGSPRFWVRCSEKGPPFVGYRVI